MNKLIHTLLKERLVPATTTCNFDFLYLPVRNWIIRFMFLLRVKYRSEDELNQWDFSERKDFFTSLQFKAQNQRVWTYVISVLHINLIQFYLPHEKKCVSRNSLRTSTIFLISSSHEVYNDRGACTHHSGMVSKPHCHYMLHITETSVWLHLEYLFTERVAKTLKIEDHFLKLSSMHLPIKFSFYLFRL